MHRRVAALLLACLAVPALAFAGDTSPKRKINGADERKAAAIVIKRGDLATGWKAIKAPSAGAEPLSCPYYRPDYSDLTLTGDAYTSFQVTGGGQYLDSYADVYVTPQEAAASWSRTVKPALARCFGDTVKEASEADPAVVAKGMTSRKLAFPRLAPRTTAYRIDLTLKVTEDGKSVLTSQTMHVLVLGRGRVEVGIVTYAPKPGVPVAELRAIGKLAADRMKAAGF